MGRETVLFESEEIKTRGEAAEILRKIAEKVESGTVSLQKGDNTFDIDFPPNLKLEIKAEEESGKKTKRSFEIELEWIVGNHDQGSMVIG